MRRHDESDESRVEKALAELWDRLPSLSDDELGTIAETASSRVRSASDGVRRRRRLGLRTAFAVAGVALLVGSGLGFGLGSSLTPSGSATALVGFGFIPAQGWNVTQSGTLDATGVARAVAANVPLDPRDDLRGEPLATIRNLASHGVLISAIFRPRGDAEVDATFPVRQAPLRLEDAAPAAGGRYRLRAAIRGYNVTLAIHFGGAEPSRAARTAAQRQLDRLVVAAEQVTIFARPTVLPARNPRTTLFGSIESGKAGELVTIQAKDCGSDFFRVVDGATTEEGGRWSEQYTPGINTTLRAVWNDHASNQVTVRQRPWVSLQRKSRSRFEVGASSAPRGGMPGGAQASFWGKRVLFQRMDRRTGRWVTVKQVALRSGRTEFRASIPSRTLVRAVLPLSQARPCFLSGVSFTLRT